MKVIGIPHNKNKKRKKTRKTKILKRRNNHNKINWEHIVITKGEKKNKKPNLKSESIKDIKL